MLPTQSSSVFAQILPATSECDSWCEALLWIVPAKVQGTWTLESATLALKQDYQNLSGTLTDAKGARPVTGKLLGEEITLTAGGVVYKGIVHGDRIEGTIATSAASTQFSAIRR